MKARTTLFNDELPHSIATWSAGSTCIKCLDTAVSGANGQKVEGRAEGEQQAVLHAHRLHLGMSSCRPAINMMSEGQHSLGRPKHAAPYRGPFHQMFLCSWVVW